MALAVRDGSIIKPPDERVVPPPPHPDPNERQPVTIADLKARLPPRSSRPPCAARHGQALSGNAAAGKKVANELGYRPDPGINWFSNKLMAAMHEFDEKNVDENFNRYRLPIWIGRLNRLEPDPQLQLHRLQQ